MHSSGLVRSSIGRRSFLKHAAAASVVGSVAMSGTRVGPAEAADCAPNDGPKSLVCVFLAGGADSFNMFLPYDLDTPGSTHATYAATRGPLAVPRSSINPVGDGTYGFNALLPSMRTAYDAGDLAVIGNVGPLTAPTTQADLIANRPIPEFLFAHDAQQKLWQTSASRVGGNDFGWGGQLGDALHACSPGSTVGPAFSAQGSNIWQNSAASNYLRLSPTVPIRRMVGFDPSTRAWLDSTESLAATLDAMLSEAETSSNEIENVMGSALRTSVATSAQLESIMSDNADNDIGFGSYGGNRLARQLHLAAKLINARDELGLERQTIFVRMGGWDTHSNQNLRFPALLDELDTALGLFRDVLGPGALDIADSVTTFTSSDFGRTLTSNGDGSDHAWGGHSFVMGGAVSGGDFFGTMPSFATTNNPDDTGAGQEFAGRLIPTQSVNQLGATLARWMGATVAEIDQIFPDLANFTNRDLGFFG